MIDLLLEEALVMRRMLPAVSLTLALAVAPGAGCAPDPEEELVEAVRGLVEGD